MRRISVRNLRPGMELAKKITHGDGAPLLNVGVKLQPKYIQQLKRMNISAVYVHDSLIPDVEVEDVILEETRERAINQVRTALTGLKQTKGNISINKLLNVKKDLSVVLDDIVSQLLGNPDLTVNLSDIRSADNYTFSHSVNVAILAIMTAISMGNKITALKSLGLGAFLHDLGKITIPPAILNKPGLLNEAEREEMMRHPQYGFNLIRHKKAFSYTSLAIISNHHERIDGSGYPQGLTGNDLDSYSKICAVTDVYDALTSDRPYRPGFAPHKAKEIIALESAGFDLQVLQVFYRHIAAYPIGTIVGLSNGLLGVVVANTHGYPTRPRVRVFAEREEFIPREEHEINLKETLNLVVEKVYEDHELPEFLFKFS